MTVSKHGFTDHKNMTIIDLNYYLSRMKICLQYFPMYLSAKTRCVRSGVFYGFEWRLLNVYSSMCLYTPPSMPCLTRSDYRIKLSPLSFDSLRVFTPLCVFFYCFCQSKISIWQFQSVRRTYHKKKKNKNKKQKFTKISNKLVFRFYQYLFTCFYSFVQNVCEILK